MAKLSLAVILGVLACLSQSQARQPETLPGLSKHELKEIVKSQFSGHEIQPSELEKLKRGKLYILKTVFYILSSLAHSGPSHELRSSAKRVVHAMGDRLKTRAESIAELMYRITQLKGYTTTLILSQFLSHMVDFTNPHRLNQDLDSLLLHVETTKDDLKVLGRLGSEQPDTFRWMDYKTLEKFLTRHEAQN